MYVCIYAGFILFSDGVVRSCFLNCYCNFNLISNPPPHSPFPIPHSPFPGSPGVGGGGGGAPEEGRGGGGAGMGTEGGARGGGAGAAGGGGGMAVGRLLGSDRASPIPSKLTFLSFMRASNREILCRKRPF